MPTAETRLILKTAEHYLTTITSPIRIFITEGLGFGDQVFGIQLIRNLRAMGYRGDIELIGNNHFKIRYKISDGLDKTISHALANKLLGKLPLAKIGIILGVRIDENKTIDRLVTTPDTETIRIRDWRSFKQSPQNRVELSIFAGFQSFVVRDYDVFGGWKELSANRLANSTRAIMLDPFTEKPSHFIEKTYGFDIQIDGSAVRFFSKEKMLPYTVLPPTATAINFELNKLHKNLALKNTLQNLLRPKKNFLTFAIYGLDPMPLERPENKLLSFITAGSYYHQQHSKKPLVIPLLNSFENQTWTTLQQYFASPLKLKLPTPVKLLINRVAQKIKFLDATMINDFQLEQNTTYVLRLPSLSYSIFNQLILNSDYPPVYQGSNIGGLLRTASKLGIVCNRLRRSVYDYGLPDVIVNADFCPNDPYKIVDPRKIIKIMRQLRNESWPEFNGADRLSDALFEVSRQPLCEEHATARCAFFSRPRFNSFMHRALKTQETALLGAGYGASLTLMERFFQTIFHLNPKVAKGVSQFILSTGILLSHKEISEYTNLMVIMSSMVIGIMTCDENISPVAQAMHTMLMFSILMMNFVNELQDYSLESLIFVAFLTVVCAYSTKLGSAMVEKLIAMANMEESTPTRSHSV